MIDTLTPQESDLLAAWIRRDGRYTHRRLELSRVEELVIREQRRAEALQLQSRLLWLRAQAWVAPKPLR